MKVELKDILKHFGATRANDGVTFTVGPGTLHGLLGENGAGKSTLMKILSGYFSPDSGEICLDGRPVRFASTSEAVDLGVGMLHQDPLDFPALQVIDNFILGSSRDLLLDRARCRSQLFELASRFDFRLDPDRGVSSLSIGERQQLEIVRLLSLGVRVLILDEPTTAISAQQREKLFQTLRQLTKEGKSIIFVSHKLEEVQGLCGNVTVLVRGKVTGEATMPCPTEQLVRMMFGQSITVGKRCKVKQGEPVLELQNVTVSNRGVEVKDLSFEIRAGEVVGLAGLEGSGQQLVMRACAGLLMPSSGHIRIANKEMNNRPYRQFIEMGAAHMPAGRLEEGLIAGMTLTEHMALIEKDPPFFVDWALAEKKISQSIREFNIKGHPSTLVEKLSGGNQQRALLSLLPSQPKILLMEHPSRGLDLDSAEYIWGLLQKRTEQGTAILFISSDLDELIDRSDRILVFFAGKVKSIDACGTNLFQLGELIGGRGFEERAC